MDFGALLNVAQRNESSKQTAACYPTKFTPPKKESKQTKVLSQNIKKFLAKKEEEERRKAVEEKNKKQNLLALRDHKAQSRINKHLKVCKAANKSVLEDAVDTENTAVTMAGPSQPDEDDYGYVSHEASAFYNKLMNKYNSMPVEKPLFNCSGKKTIKDIASTKDRVKQALKQQEIEESQGSRRKRKSSLITKDCESGSVSEVALEEKNNAENGRKLEKIKSKKKQLLPPMDFVQLLKLAEKKQHEPIVVELKPKKEEPERLMTKRQIKEYAKEKEWRDTKEERHRTCEFASTRNTSAVDCNKFDKPRDSKAESLNDTRKISTDREPLSKSSPAVASKKPVARSTERINSNSNSIQQESKDKEALLEERRKLEVERRKLEEMRRNIEEEKRKLSAIKGKNIERKKSFNVNTNQFANKIDNISERELAKGNSMKRVTVTSPSYRKSRPIPAEDFKSIKNKKILVKNKKQTNISSKQRAVFNDDEDEYDSELDDFIDDEPEEENEDYSKYISEIFGYDKSKYKNNDDDDSAMESNFAQQLKEEYVSTKIGIMEDLEDIRKEAIEKKRKALFKKKRKI